MFLCKAVDGKPMNLVEGQEIWLEKDSENSWETTLFRVVAIEGKQAVLQEIPSGCA
jgi:hypothetical protein